MHLDRQGLINQIPNQLTKRYQTQKSAYQQALATSIQAEGAMQTHHDTTKEEMAKLADACLRDMNQTQKAIDYFKRQKPEKVGPECVGVGNLVKVIEKDGERLYLIAKQGGGFKLSYQRNNVLVVSSSAPIGKALLGQRLGAVVKVRSPVGPGVLRVVKIE